MLLLGDSLLKQLFISLACDLSDDVAQSHIEWATEQAPWGCMATHNCIRTGRHSGFHNGSVAFKSGGELHYLELHGTVMRDVVDGLQKDLEQEGQITIGEKTMLVPAMTISRTVLSEGDVLVLMVGIHQRGGNLVKTLQRVRLLSKALMAAPRRPSFVFITTPTQHFRTTDGSGQYLAEIKEAGCIQAVPANPRRDLELQFIKSGMVDRIIDYGGMDKDLGMFHIGADASYGGIDCSHYCMPGVPDWISASLIDAVHDLQRQD